MAFGFPPSVTIRIPVTACRSGDLWNATRAACASLGWAATESPGRIFVSRSPSFLSWGEHIEIIWEGPGSIVATSRGAFPLQWIDWGKNASNLSQLTAAIGRY